MTPSRSNKMMGLGLRHENTLMMNLENECGYLRFTDISEVGVADKQGQGHVARAQYPKPRCPPLT